MSHIRVAIVVILILCAIPADGDERLLVTIGEVTPTSAVVWARSEAGGHVVVELTSRESEMPFRATLRLSEERDRTGKIVITGLTPATRYLYRLARGAESVIGHFVTAPTDQEARPVVFLWSGDLGGGSHCRRLGNGYPIFLAMARRLPDFFLFVGDTVYADHRCTGAGVVPGADFVAQTLPEFHRKHHHNRADATVQNFFRTTSVYATWDDHDVRNNFAARTEPRAPVGLRAFLDYWPIMPPDGEPTRLYRRVRWGRVLDVFILDTRQYRSRDCQLDGPWKTMLGAAQRRWLLDTLASSDSVWKIVVSSVSLSIPKGWPCGDSWAPGGLWLFRTGFATERDGILEVLRARQVKNVVVLAADLHYADLIRHRLAPDFTFHEFTAGPLAATPKEPEPLDATLAADRLVAQGGLTNFGEIAVDRTTLTVRIIDEYGQVLVTRIVRAED